MVRVSFVLATTIGCGLLTACSVQPAYPLLTPIQLAHNFGYAERPVDDTHWVVSYVSPEEQGHSSRFSNPPLGAHAKAMAFDLALWHASQIALARGYTGFSVVDRHFNTDAYETADYPHDPYWDGGFSAHSEEGFFGRFGWGGAWSSELSPSPNSNVQVEAELKIVLTNEPKNADDFRATDTINRLRATYPAADALPLHPAA